MQINKSCYLYTQGIRQSLGIDLLTNTHKILPRFREERIKKKTICVRWTWNAEIVENLKQDENNDHIIIIKERDSAFHDTEIKVWLRRTGVDSLIFYGIHIHLYAWNLLCVTHIILDMMLSLFLMPLDKTTKNTMNQHQRM